MRKRAVQSFLVLRARADVDTQKIFAIGYCFGGTAVLELAYSGADVAGAVTFHAGLVAPKPDEYPAIRAKLLILHGADDPGASPEKVEQFQEALRAAKADWQMVFFGNAVHAFTNPSSGNDARRGSAYNPAAARRSWIYMSSFMDEIMASNGSGR
jgi:dienelactone hydrolase